MRASISDTTKPPLIVTTLNGFELKRVSITQLARTNGQSRVYLGGDGLLELNLALRALCGHGSVANGRSDPLLDDLFSGFLKLP